jgi:hypothetical protein
MRQIVQSPERIGDTRVDGQESRMPDRMLESIARTRHRPAMYLGAHSAEAMFLYLVGYSGALEEHTNIDLTLYTEFLESLCTRYGRGSGGHSWAWVLGQLTGSDSAALDLFYDELDKFLQQNS